MPPARKPQARLVTTPLELRRFNRLLQEAGVEWPGVLELLKQLEDAKYTLGRIAQSHHHPEFHKEAFRPDCPGCIAHEALFRVKEGNEDQGSISGSSLADRNGGRPGS